jgi:hypothetical protein
MATTTHKTHRVNVWEGVIGWRGRGTNPTQPTANVLLVESDEGSKWWLICRLHQGAEPPANKDTKATARH